MTSNILLFKADLYCVLLTTDSLIFFVLIIRLCSTEVLLRLVLLTYYQKLLNSLSIEKYDFREMIHLISLSG
jgi:hypothetical protein